MYKPNKILNTLSLLLMTTQDIVTFTSETFEKFKEFRFEDEKQLSKTIKTYRSDRGDEYLDTEFINYLIENGIVSQLSVPGDPQ